MPATAEPESGDQPETGEDDVKRRFREALERKNKTSHHTSGGGATNDMVASLAGLAKAMLERTREVERGSYCLAASKAGIALEAKTISLGDLADVVALDAFSEEALRGRVEQADAIMMYHFIAIGRATIDRLEKCRLIVRCGVGFDNVDRQAARERGIAVANVPDYGTEEVADSAIAIVFDVPSMASARRGLTVPL